MVYVGPGSAAPVSGFFWSTTSAVITLATEPIGHTLPGERLASEPDASDTRSKLPAPGTGIAGAVPGARARLAGRPRRRCGGGGVLSSFTPAQAPPPTTSRVIAVKTSGRGGAAGEEPVSGHVSGMGPQERRSGLPGAGPARAGRRRSGGPGQRLRPLLPLSDAESVVEGAKRTTRRAGTRTSSPVLGLRPMRAARCWVRKLPKP